MTLLKTNWTWNGSQDGTTIPQRNLSDRKQELQRLYPAYPLHIPKSRLCSSGFFVDVFDLYGSDLLNRAQVVLNYCCLIHFPVPLRHMMLLRIGSSAFNLRNTSTPDGKRQTATIGNPYFLANDLITQLCTKPGVFDKCNPWLLEVLAAKRDLFTKMIPTRMPGISPPTWSIQRGTKMRWTWEPLPIGVGGHLSSRDWGSYMIAHG